MSNYMLATLAKELDERIEFFRDDLAGGTAKDFGEFKYGCGVIRGLHEAKELIADMTRKLERDEDE